MAKFGTLDPRAGYSRDQNAWADDHHVPTRLGDTVELCLVRWDGAAVTPWAGEGGWASGDLRLRVSLIIDAIPALDGHPAVVRLRNEPSTLAAFRYRTPIPLSAAPDDSRTWHIEIPGSGGRRWNLRYHDESGLTIDTERAPGSP